MHISCAHADAPTSFCTQASMPSHRRQTASSSSAPQRESQVREADTASLDASRAQLASRTSEDGSGSERGGSLSLWGAASTEQAQGGEGDIATANASPTLAEVDGGAIIDQGHRGPAVEWVQGALNRLGFPVGQSGIFGSMTIGLLQQFQSANSVQATGKVGPTTLARLRDAVDASVSLEEVQQLAPGVDRATLAEYLPHLNAAMLEHGITSDARKAAFLAQLGHESDGFNTLEEYASGANYEWRSDLGNVFAGDGRRFKGRGPIQITGRANYKEYGQKIGVDLIANPELAATAEHGFDIAGQYWADNGLNELADEGRFDTITRRINGGQNGRADRRRRWGQAQDVLGNSAGQPKVPMPGTSRRGQDTSDVMRVSHVGPTQETDVGDGEGTNEGTAALAEICRRIGENDASGARDGAASFASARRTELGVANDALTSAAGEVWTAADRIVRAQSALDSGDAKAAQDAAHKAAEGLRSLRDRGALPSEAVDSGIARAGRIWTQADELKAQGQQTNGQAHDGLAVWTTGRVGGSDVTSRELRGDGGWSSDQWLTHHSDRSDSWAARNIRNAKNQDLQAYDFTFERKNANGRGIAGTAQGLELISPWDAKVHDVNQSLGGSGGYGRFIALEDLETGLRFEVHHLDTVADVRRGGTVNGGDVIGTQGGTGYGRYDYATHVDIVGTAEAVEQFVRANQSGKFRSNKRQNGA